jgi:hypothetical protein
MKWDIFNSTTHPVFKWPCPVANLIFKHVILTFLINYALLYPLLHPAQVHE